MPACHDAARLSSMTAFGLAEVKNLQENWVCEIHSVNRRHLDIQMHVPSSIRRFEHAIRKIIQKVAVRGQVTCSIRREGATAGSYNLDITNLDQMQILWDQLLTKIDGPTKMPLEFLLAHKEMLWPMVYGEMKEDAVLQLVSSAVDAWAKMKQEEGLHLQMQMKRLLDQVAEHVRRIASWQEEVIAHGKSKISTRWEQFGLPVLEPTSWVADVLQLIDQHDISEEITRLESHLMQINQLLQQPLCEGRNKGKKTEFLLQEMGREINTLGAKACFLGMVQEVVEIKTLLEQCKEQIQNIE